MLGVRINIGNTRTSVYSTCEGNTAEEIGRKVTELTGLAGSCFYIVYNGRLARGTDFCQNGTADVVLRLPGGKGGFGSMLRAIGAQIEKTTNREACRDLSGRRLRDINEEKRLKSWIDKQGTREEEAVERKKKKLERLCAQPKHEFKDKNYEMERSTLTEKVGDAVEEGFKMAMAESSGAKRKHEDKVKGRKKKLILDLDIDSDELESSSDESSSDSASEKRIKSDSSPSVEDRSSRDDVAKTEDDQGSEKSEKSDTVDDSGGSSRSKQSSGDENSDIVLPEVKESGREKEVAVAL